MLIQTVNRMLDVSFALGNSHVTPRSPWEQNSFLCNVMGPSTVPWLKPITTLRRTFYVPPKTCESNEKRFQEKKNLVREACHTKLSMRADTERVIVLLAWADILMLCPEESYPSKLLMSCAGNDELVLQTMLDLFAGKSTCTVRTRSGSLAMYRSWPLNIIRGNRSFPSRKTKSMDTHVHVEIVGAQHQGLTLLLELSAMWVASLALLGPKWQQSHPESLGPHIACC